MFKRLFGSFSTTKTENNFVPLQTRVFTRWIRNNISGNKDYIYDITKDLTDGVALCELANNITHTDIEIKWKKDPRSTQDKISNCDLAINAFLKDGVKLPNISGKDINNNNINISN